jgi:hypothetical protein
MDEKPVYVSDTEDDGDDHKDERTSVDESFVVNEIVDLESQTQRQTMSDKGFSIGCCLLLELSLITTMVGLIWNVRRHFEDRFASAIGVLSILVDVLTILKVCILQLMMCKFISSTLCNVSRWLLRTVIMISITVWFVFSFRFSESKHIWLTHESWFYTSIIYTILFLCAFPIYC